MSEQFDMKANSMPEQFDILGGKVHIFKRPNSGHWQCSTYIAGIEKYYAAHLKTPLDASAINVMRPRSKKKTVPKKGPGRVEATRLAEEA